MAANPSHIPVIPQSIIEDMLHRMQALAAEGDWQRVQTIAEGICKIIPQVPASRRAEVIHQAQRSMAQVEAHARSAHREVGGKLSTIRRGQGASRAYEDAAGAIDSR